MVLQKYSAALLNVAVVLVTAVATTLHGSVTATGLVQLALIAAGAVGTFLVPLASGKWAGLFKTGVAVIAAILTAVLPLITQGHLTAANVATVILAGLSALATEIGVQIRTTGLALQKQTVTSTSEQVVNDLVRGLREGGTSRDLDDFRRQLFNGQPDAVVAGVEKPHEVSGTGSLNG